MSDLGSYKPERTTVWSFPERGRWASHSPKYRGNFAPQIARNIIEMYSVEGETVLDPMVGGGTTLIEARLLNRNAIGVDINPAAVKLAKDSLRFDCNSASTQKVLKGDARKLWKIMDESIELVLIHPPYLNIISYSDGKIAGDLSNIGSVDRFCDEIERVARQLLRVLKPNRYCAVLIGDTRKGKHCVPLAFKVMERFLKPGFVLKEDIIKVQHNCSATKRWEWKARKDRFYLLMHEHLFVFRKPQSAEDLSNIKWSARLT